MSDLTYARVGNQWNYVCILVGHFNHEIIGYSVGKNKDVILVLKAFARVNINLRNMQIFYIDRGNAFKNKLLNETLKTHDNVFETLEEL